MDVSEYLPIDDVRSIRGKLIGNQTEIIAASTRSEDYLRNFEINTEINNAKMLIEKSKENINFYTTTADLNRDTQTAINECLSGIRKSEDELQAELTAVSRRLAAAKESLNNTLEKYYPEDKEGIIKIFRELKEASLEENEEDKFRELDPDLSIPAVLTLTRTFCIVQHPTRHNFFKLAPLR